MAGLVLVILLLSVLEVLGLGLIFYLIQAILDEDFLANNPILQRTYDLSGSTSLTTFQVTLLGSVILLFIAKNSLFLASTFLQIRFVFLNMAAMSADLQSRYLYTPFVRLVERDTSDIISIQEHAIPQVYIQAILPTVYIVADIISIVAICLVLFLISPVVTFSTVAVIGIVMGAYLILTRSFLNRKGQILLDTNRSVLRLSREQLLHAKEIQVRQCQEFFLAQHREGKFRVSKMNSIIRMMATVPRVLIEVIAVAAIFLWLMFAVVQGWEIGNLAATIGMFGVAAMRLLPSANRIMTSFNHIRTSQAALDRLWNELQTQPSVDRHRSVTARKSRRFPFQESIELRDVTFSYPKQTRRAVQGINLTIAKGEAVALVGPSGAGKSTLANIILGLIEPDEGQVLVDGQDIAGKPEAWQWQVGYVPQTTNLLNDTLWRNVAFGLPDSQIDHDKVRRAIRLANLEDMIVELPEGLETVIGEQGLRLSGGQRQRIGIARALYDDPDVLVMDEATSSLDVASEHEISQAINSLSGTKTFVLIAHRLSTVQSCDRLYLMRDGHLVASGTLNELMASDPAFREMVRLSFGDRDGQDERPNIANLGQK